MAFKWKHSVFFLHIISYLGKPLVLKFSFVKKFFVIKKYCDYTLVYNSLCRFLIISLQWMFRFRIILSKYDYFNKLVCFYKIAFQPVCINGNSPHAWPLASHIENYILLETFLVILNCSCCYSVGILFSSQLVPHKQYWQRFFQTCRIKILNLPIF